MPTALVVLDYDIGSFHDAARIVQHVVSGTGTKLRDRQGMHFYVRQNEENEGKVRELLGCFPKCRASFFDESKNENWINEWKHERGVPSVAIVRNSRRMNSYYADMGGNSRQQEDYVQIWFGGMEEGDVFRIVEFLDRFKMEDLAPQNAIARFSFGLPEPGGWPVTYNIMYDGAEIMLLKNRICVSFDVESGFYTVMYAYLQAKFGLKLLKQNDPSSAIRRLCNEFAPTNKLDFEEIKPRDDRQAFGEIMRKEPFWALWSMSYNPGSHVMENFVKFTSSEDKIALIDAMAKMYPKEAIYVRQLICAFNEDEKALGHINSVADEKAIEAAIGYDLERQDSPSCLHFWFIEKGRKLIKALPQEKKDRIFATFLEQNKPKQDLPGSRRNCHDELREEFYSRLFNGKVIAEMKEGMSIS